MAQARGFADRLRQRIRKKLQPYGNVQKNLLELDGIDELKRVMSWNEEGLVDDDDLYVYRSILDANFRRLRDAEVIATCCKNVDPGNMLEIGTASGRMTSIMSINSPNSTIYTVNIPPEEISEGGTYTSYAPSREEIGKVYKEKNCPNVSQIYANTANWEPDFNQIRCAFIDGSHDWDFVVNDATKILKKACAGSVLCFHDFEYNLVEKYNWISDVVYGVEMLYRTGHLKGPIYHVKGSWVGIYVVP